MMIIMSLVKTHDSDYIANLCDLKLKDLANPFIYVVE